MEFFKKPLTVIKIYFHVGILYNEMNFPNKPKQNILTQRKTICHVLDTISIVCLK